MTKEKAEILKNQLDELNSKIIKIQNDIEFVSKMLEETENTLDELQKSDEKSGTYIIDRFITR